MISSLLHPHKDFGQSEILYDWRFTANLFVFVPSPLMSLPPFFFWQLNLCGHSPLLREDGIGSYEYVWPLRSVGIAYKAY
jgi:hypothetical protein